MIAIPAVDIRDGACVQLVGGSYAQERVRIDDAPTVAAGWQDHGFRRLHVVDLDAATERRDNADVVERILGQSRVEVQVGGGVRSTARVRELMSAGAHYVVTGTLGIENREWLAETASQWPGKLVVAADVRGRAVVTHGWNRTLTLDVASLLSEIASLPLAAVLVTAVHVEGQMRGPDLGLVDDIVGKSSTPLFVAGGICSIEDLRALAQRGVAGAVIGMALYTGALDARAVAEEFGT